VKYSVWNTATGLFDYFESSRQQRSQNVEKPTHLRGSQTLGAAVDQAAWPLPSDARPVGSGSVAIGRVASRGGGARALGDGMFGGGGLEDLAVFALIGVMFWKFVVKPKPRYGRRSR
jgi:hypothetical protein